MLCSYSFTLTAAALVYFYFGPVGAQDSEDVVSMPGSGLGVEGPGIRCGDVVLPVTLYSSLFVMLIVHILVAVNEEAILLVSAGGTVWNDKPRRWLPKLLYLRVVLFVLDIAMLAYVTWAVFNNGTAAQLAPCPPYSNALRLSRAIVVVVWITSLFYAVGFLIFLDPCGCYSSTSLLNELRCLSYRARDETDGGNQAKVKKRKVYRRLQIICSLFGIKEASETTLALRDIADNMYELFKNVNLVPSDLLVGLLFLRRDQKKKMKSGRMAELIDPLREVSQII